jgi:hypothetical membrane protein
VDRTSASARIGAAGAVLALGCVLLATAVSPAFSWRANALSNLGAATPAATPATRLLFNGGLAVGGLLVAPLSYALAREAGNPLDKLASVAFLLTAVALALIGLFPQGTALHFPVAVGFYLLVSVSLWLHGIGRLKAGVRRGAAVSLFAGTTNAGAWTLWAVTGPVRRPGLAIPEIVGAAAIAAWTVRTARRLHRPPRPGDSASSEYHS